MKHLSKKDRLVLVLPNFSVPLLLFRAAFIVFLLLLNIPWTQGVSLSNFKNDLPYVLTKTGDDPAISAIENRLVSLIRNLRKVRPSETEQNHIILAFSEKAAHICPNFDWTNLFTTEGSALAVYVRNNPEEALELVAFLAEIERNLNQRESGSTPQEIQNEELVKLFTKLYMTADGTMQVNDQINVTLSQLAPNFDQQLLKSRLHPDAFHHFVHNHTDEAAQLIRWLHKELIANQPTN